jgi:hypothetical protein
MRNQAEGVLGSLLVVLADWLKGVGTLVSWLRLVDHVVLTNMDMARTRKAKQVTRARREGYL